LKRILSCSSFNSKKYKESSTICIVLTVSSNDIPPEVLLWAPAMTLSSNPYSPALVKLMHETLMELVNQVSQVYLGNFDLITQISKLEELQIKNPTKFTAKDLLLGRIYSDHQVMYIDDHIKHCRRMTSMNPFVNIASGF
jgi:hypothetical protein